MNRLTSEPCLNDNSQNRDTTHEDAVQELADKILSGETIYADVGGTVYDYDITDVVSEMNKRLLGNYLAKLALSAEPSNSLMFNHVELLAVSVRMAAYNLADRIYENVQVYLER